ncbi:MAG: ribonuclease H-like domain-containing protein [Ignavibacteria bacterium]|jgi:predicted PolB exonuclease-like 3'-5' exonuclease
MDISNRNILVFDIETIGHKLDDFPEEVRKYLIKDASDEGDIKEIVEQFVFNPLTSKIAAIGMLDNREEKGCILVNTEEETTFLKNHENFNYINGTEEGILKIFWDTLVSKKYNLFVTFNGREFDCPFVMLRSLYYRIKPTVNLMKGSDFTFKDYHIDLLKEFTFNTHSGRGARRKFSLDFYCRTFGIPSPKKDGVTGDLVDGLYKEKKFQEIADYCIGDVIAENELLKYWNEYFNL